MKNHLRKKRAALVVLLVGMPFFQNCGRMVGFNAASELTGSLVGDQYHPGEEKVTPPAQKTLLVNKTYVAEILRDVFSSTSAPVPNLEGLLQTWVLNRPAQFGGSCSPYDTWSGRDCGGDTAAGASLPVQTDDNTIRHSFRIQVCENILGYDQAVNAVLAKLSAPMGPPNPEFTAQVYQLFSRSEEVDPRLVSTLLELDRVLAEKGEPTLERWRALILQVCESPGWQLL